MQVDSNSEFINQLNWHSNQSTKALGRLASGSRILAPQDDAAGLAVATRIQAQLSQYDAAKSGLANAVSFTQTQNGFLEGAQEVFNRMGSLAIRAQDATLNDEQRALFQGEFRKLKETFNDIRTTQFNGKELFDGKELSLSISAKQNPIKISGIDLFTPEMNDVTAGTTLLKTPETAQSALKTITMATEKINQDRALAGSTLAELESVNASLENEYINAQAGLSRITDSNIASEVLNLSREAALEKINIFSVNQENELKSRIINLLG